MTTQLEASMDDGSECYISAAFFDINGNPYVPSSLQYQLDDITNGVNIIPLTTFGGALATSILQQITSTQNVMNAASGVQERRQMLFKIGIPGGTFRYDDITYILLRKSGTP